MDGTLLDVEQAAKLIGVHPRTLYKWARSRRVPCIRLQSKLVRFDPRALDKWLRASSVEAR